MFPKSGIFVHRNNLFPWNGRVKGHGFKVLSSSSWIKDFFHNGWHDYYPIMNMQMNLLCHHYGVKIPLILSMLTELGRLIYFTCIQKNKNLARYLWKRSVAFFSLWPCRSTHWMELNFKGQILAYLHLWNVALHEGRPCQTSLSW